MADAMIDIDHVSFAYGSEAPPRLLMTPIRQVQ